MRLPTFSRRTFEIAAVAAVMTRLSFPFASGAAQEHPQPAAPLAAPGAADKAGPDAHGPTGYRIGAGDELQISVWNEPQASVPGVVVRPDGKISLPLVK